MNLSVIILCVVCSLCAKLMEYRFYRNYGQIFNDFSNNNLSAVNGDSSKTTTYDSMPTDRGAYFTGSSVEILLTPNDIATKNYILPSTFSIII